VAAAVVVCAILALSLFFTIRLIRARDQALASDARTQRIDRFMLHLFAGDDSVAGPSAGLRVVDLLDRGVAQAKSLQDEPRVRAQLQFTLGSLYHRLGHPDRAEPLLRSAVNEQVKLLGRQNSETMKSLLAFADILAEESKYPEAERIARDVLNTAKRRNSVEDLDVAAAQAELGAVLASEGHYADALPSLQEAVGVLSKHPQGAELLSEAYGYLTWVHYYSGHVQAADAVNQRALTLDKQLYGPLHPSVGVDLQNLGDFQLDRGEYRAAEQTFSQVLTIYRAWYGALHPKTAAALLLLGSALSYQGRYDPASALYSQALLAAKNSSGEQSYRYAVALTMAGGLARDRNELAKAEKLFLQAAQILKKTLGEEHEIYAFNLSNLGSVYLADKQFARAEEILGRALRILQRVVPDQRYTGITQTRLAAALAGQKRYTEAETQALAAYNTLKKQLGPAAKELQDAREQLYRSYLADKQLVKAGQFP
jgi:eukaryotic-like serine/threonine-protein kinase